MKTLQLLLFSFLFTSATIGQTNHFIIKGSVSNTETNEPIENVNITLSGDTYGTTTNAVGEFEIRINKLPFSLQFSHINYDKTILRYDHIPLQNLHVKLSRKTELLSEITITSEKVDIIYEDDEYSVLDYELTEEGILLLIFKNRLSRAELLYINYEGEELSKLRVLPLKPLMLFKDCLNSINIVSKDYVRQVYFGTDKIELYKPVKIEHFKQVMGDCQFLIEDKLYFAVNSYYDLIKDYYYIDTADNSRHNFASALDHYKMSFLANNPENLLYANGKAGPLDLGSFSGMPGDSAILNAIRNSNVTLRFNKMAYYSEIYAPIFQMGDSICIFNHPENKILFYSLNDSLISQTDISYHKTNNKRGQLEAFLHAFAKPNKWLEEVYVDKQQHKAYTMFQNLSGTRDLKEINLSTGEISFIMEIPFPYVQKIKVENGALFFVYKGWGSNPQKKLYRQRIN